jgi:hypothetical protein
MSHDKQIHAPITPLNPPEPVGQRKWRELAGERPAEDQAAYLDRSQVDAAAPLTPTELYEEELLAGLAEAAFGIAELPERQPPEPLADRASPLGLDLLIGLELRAGETADPLVASDEGATYVPPIDPPVIPGHTGSFANAEIASGLGLSALDEPYDESHHSSFLPDDDEMSARVREALRADSSTSAYADTIAIETRDGMVRLSGVVDDLIDNDNLLAVASDVAGVTEVVDGLRVRWMAAQS